MPAKNTSGNFAGENSNIELLTRAEMKKENNRLLEDINAGGLGTR